jgi:hypothetical protein
MADTRPERLRAWCWLAVRVPWLLFTLPLHYWWTRRANHRLLAAYRRTLVPLLREHLHDAPHADETDDRLVGWALQGGYLVDSYAQMVGERDVEDLAVMAASFTRVYDDLIDARSDPKLGDRLAALFAHRPVTPASDLEALLGDIFRWIDARVPASRRSDIYAELHSLHELQLTNSDHASGLSEAEVLRLTLAKGGAAMFILGSLVGTHVDHEEPARLRRLGGLLQLIDDYDDAVEDGARLTSATHCHLSFGELIVELRGVGRELLAAHGRRSGERYVEGLAIWLVLVGIRRTIDRARRFDGRLRRNPARQLAMLTARKPHIR